MNRPARTCPSRPAPPGRRRHYRTALACVGLALVACGGGAPPEPAAATAVSAAPVTGADVESVSADDLGRLVTSGGARVRLVNFWATWCAPCLLEIPDLVAFAADHPEVEVVLVNLDLPSMRATHVAKFLAEHDVRGVRVVQIDDADPGGVAARMVPGWNDMIPLTLLLRTDGSRAATFRRAVSRAELDEKLATL